MSAILQHGPAASGIAIAAQEVADLEHMWQISVIGSLTFNKTKHVTLPRFLLDSKDVETFENWVFEGLEANHRSHVEVTFITTRAAHMYAMVSDS